MKNSATAWTILSLASILPLSAQTTQTTEKSEISRNADGSVTETQTTTTETFNPEIRTKVVTYFDGYKSERYGLPPEWVSKIHVKEIPSGWRIAGIAPGAVVTQEQRSYLIAAPAELVKLLPPPKANIHYYVAGSNVVAVDNNYKVIDSVRIPTIKYTEDDDEVKIEKTEGGKKTRIEVDKDDGEVEVDTEDD